MVPMKLNAFNNCFNKFDRCIPVSISSNGKNDLCVFWNCSFGIGATRRRQLLESQRDLHRVRIDECEKLTKKNHLLNNLDLCFRVLYVKKTFNISLIKSYATVIFIKPLLKYKTFCDRFSQHAFLHFKLQDHSVTSI